MTSVLTAARSPWWAVSVWPGRFAQRHPDWVVWVAAAAAWAVIVGLEAGSAAHGTGGDLRDHSWVVIQAGWMLMTLAMMGPSTVPAVRRVAFDSLPRRRSRAISIWLAAYFAVWLVFGTVATGFATFGERVRWALPGALLVAAAYELSRRKRRALRACHVTVPLPPNGRKADIACARAGVRHGTACVEACWALMTAMAVAGHGSLLLMVLLSTIIVAQRWLVVATRLGPHVAVILVATAALVVL